MLAVAADVFAGSCIFSTFWLFIACSVKARERFMGIGQARTMPLFLASKLHPRLARQDPRPPSSPPFPSLALLI